MKSKDEPIISTPAGIQRRVILQVALLFVVTILFLECFVNFRPFSEWLIRSDQQINRKDLRRYSYAEYFVDFEDRLINEELPRLNFDKGGVHLFGTSNLKWATRFWELPEEQRELIHNFGLGSCNHGFQFQFLRYLVEHHGLLKAGGERNMVIVGGSYHCVGNLCDPNGFFARLWDRHGLYKYDLNSGITPLKSNKLSRWIHFERVRIRGCFRAIASNLAHRAGWNAKPRVHNVARYNKDRADWMDKDWQQKMTSQIGELENMVNYLIARHVKVVLVLLPMGFWEDSLPFAREYARLVSAIAHSKGLELHDWTDIFEDIDFADSNHPSVYGVDKLNARFLDIGVPFLLATGALK